MAGINEMIFMKTSGMYDDERALKERVQSYHEAVSELQWNPETKQYGYLSGSDKALKGTYNSAMEQEFNNMFGVVNNLSQQVQQLQNDKTAGTQANAIMDAITGTDYGSLNTLIGEDEKTAQMFKSLGAQSVSNADFTNPKHMDAYKQAGINPDVVDALVQRAMQAKEEGREWNQDEELAAISKAWPVVQGVDNKLSAASLPEFIGATAMQKRLGSSERAAQMRDFIARSYKAIQGVSDEVFNAQNILAQQTAEQAKIKSQVDQVSLDDMQNFLNSNPNASLADYIGKKSSSGSGAEKKTAMQQNYEYILETQGEEAANAYLNKAAFGADTSPAAVKQERHDLETMAELTSEAGVDSIYNINYSKLKPDSQRKMEYLAQKQAKDIKKEELNSLFELENAANKLNSKDLAATTGIADATFNHILDTLGLDLPDKVLVQSSNYNLIKNSITRAAMGTQVTGGELKRITAQLGNEFKADKTVRIKMAETLDNLAAKFEQYKYSAPAYYAVAMKPRVENLSTMSAELRGDTSEGTKSITTAGGKSYEKQGNKLVQTSVGSYEDTGAVKKGDVINGMKFLGGAANDKDNWVKVK